MGDIQLKNTIEMLKEEELVLKERRYERGK